MVLLYNVKHYVNKWRASGCSRPPRMLGWGRFSVHRSSDMCPTHCEMATHLHNTFHKYYRSTSTCCRSSFGMSGTTLISFEVVYKYIRVTRSDRHASRLFSERCARYLCHPFAPFMREHTKITGVVVKQVVYLSAAREPL